MKSFKFGTALQIIYCFGCIVVIVSMLLYHAFYDVYFGKTCFKVGEVFTLVSTFNPLAFIGTIITFVCCFSTELRKSKKLLLLTVTSPVVALLSYIFAVSFFVGFGGGV